MGDVVDVDVVAEYGGGVDVGFFDRGACESEVSGVGEGIAEVFGESVDDFFADRFSGGGFFVDCFSGESVLSAVGFVSDDDDVATIGELIVNVAVVGLEFLDGGEDDPAGADFEQGFELVAGFGLAGGLAQELFGAGEGVEELVVEVVAIGDDEDGGVVKGEDDLSGVEDHGEGFAGALGVPDDSGFTIAFGLVLAVGETVAGGGFFGAGWVAAEGAEGGEDGGVDGVVLVVGGEFFGGADADDVGFWVFFFGVLEDDEVAD